MEDTFGRNIRYLRLSVTELCDLRCRYCMAEEGVCKRGHEELCSFEELREFTAAAAAIGVTKLRVTGGEPLVRRGIVELCAMLRTVPGIEELCLTTNGTRLEQLAAPLKAVGVDRLNISLDTLRPERYREITRTGELENVLRGIEAAERAGFENIKLNCVLLGGMNDDEIGDFVRLTAKKPWQVRFIELMPMGGVAAGALSARAGGPLPHAGAAPRGPQRRRAAVPPAGSDRNGRTDRADELRLLRGLHKNTHHGGREAQALPALGRRARAARIIRCGAGSSHPPGHPDEAGTAPHGRDRRHRDAPRDVCDRRMKMELTHFNEQGRARMVDVSEKAQTYRVARAAATVRMAKATMDRIREGSIGKGDVLAVAQVAGIMAAKKNSELIPMCHPLLLTKVDISFETEEAALHIRSEVRCHGETGVEMEALTAVSVAALTVYDMCKAVQRDMRIDGIRLLYKEGGKSGVYEAEE